LRHQPGRKARSDAIVFAFDSQYGSIFYYAVNCLRARGTFRLLLGLILKPQCRVGSRQLGMGFGQMGSNGHSSFQFACRLLRSLLVLIFVDIQELQSCRLKAVLNDGNEALQKFITQLVVFLCFFPEALSIQ